MPVVNDVPGAWEAIRAEGERLAALTGVQKEVFWGFFNSNGRFPANIGELEQWGNTPDRIYGIRRRQPNGVWNPIMPGPTPGTLGEKDPGFRHVISNAEDTDVERFKDFNPGIIQGFGQSSPNAFRADATMRSAQAGNPYAPGMPQADPALAATWDAANPPPGQAGTPTPQASGGGGAGGGGGGGASSGLGPLVDAAAYGNTQTLQAQIDDAIRRYALARTAEERNQAYLDLQRWQTELGKAEGQQKRYDAMAQALLSASVQLQNNPRDWVKFNQYTSGGRDVFAQMQQAGPAFAGPTGPIEPGSVNDLLQRLGIGPSPATPATPAGVLPGAANPHNPELPAVPVPGSAGGPPGALQAGAGGAAPAAATVPGYEQMLAELDRAAGGRWGGNRADRATVGREWWNADPARRGQPMPAWG